MVDSLLTQPSSKSGRDERESTSTARPGTGLGLSERTLAVLANLNEDTTRPRRRTVEKKKMMPPPRSPRLNKQLDILAEGNEDEENIEETDTVFAPPIPKPKKGQLTDVERAERLFAKARHDHDKRVAAEKKLAEKERKQKLNEEKAKEKQRATELALANRSKTDKKLSTPEMIVDLPSNLDDTNLGRSLRTRLRELGVEVVSYASPVPNVIKWRRNVTAVYEADLGHWEPVAAHVRDEKHALCIMTAQEFVNLASVDHHVVKDTYDLEAHVSRLKSCFDDHRLLFVIEGLTAWMRRNKNVRNRRWHAAVLEGMQDVGEEEGRVPPRRPSRRNLPPSSSSMEYVDEDTIEDALLRIQVMHRSLTHHTTSTDETVAWIAIFTQHISTIPYK